MNKQARVDTLRQVILHTINGERDLAEAMFKQVITAAGRRIVMGESNYSVDGDPEFDARRELQRELEDDLDGAEAGGDVTDLDGEANVDVGGEDCGDCEVIDAIVSKLEDGNVDDEVLAQILDLLVGEEGGEEGPEGIEGELDGDLGVDPAGAGEEVPAGLGADGEFNLDVPAKMEGAGATSLFDRIKFALGYDYDQFLDSGGDQADWPAVALQNPAPELEELLAQIPADVKPKYDAAIQQFIQSQVE